MTPRCGTLIIGLRLLWSFCGRGLVPCAALLLLPSHALAVDWNPGPAWRDSYSVDGICFCDSSNYDHGIGDITVATPDGFHRSVRQVCADIQRVFGTGSEQGRVPYNTIACGHGPPNDMPDEDLQTGCPGRVDQGSRGCFELGPKWPLAAVYGPPLRALDRSLWSLSSSDNQKALVAAIDKDITTRWSTNRPQASGQWLQIDFGSLQAVNRIALVTTPSPLDYPRGWQVDLSLDGKEWFPVDTGDANAAVSGKNRSVAGEVTILAFAMRIARYFRITQTGTTDHWYWSVHELQAGVVN